VHVTTFRRCAPSLGVSCVQVMRTAFFFLLLLSVASAAAAADAEQQPESTSAASAAADAAATEAPADEELPPLDCKPSELLEKATTWSTDCVALWLENLGFPELRGAFMGNKVDGSALQSISLKALKDDYGVSDEEQRKKIYYNLKDVVKKDNSTGNTNNWAEMLFWCLPFLGVYKWITLKYDKQIAKAMKRYQKWQEARNPPKPVEPVVYADGTNEWISGVNSDIGEKKKKEKKAPADKKKKPQKAE